MVIADIQPSTFSPSTVSVLACGSTFSTLPLKTCSFFSAEAAGAAGAACVFGGSVFAGSWPQAAIVTTNTTVVMIESRFIPAVYRESLTLPKWHRSILCGRSGRLLGGCVIGEHRIDDLRPLLNGRVIRR